MSDNDLQPSRQPTSAQNVQGGSAVSSEPSAPVPKKRRYRRKGNPTKVERELIQKVVLDQPHEITTSQVEALSKLLERPRAKIREIVEQAKEEFAGNAKNYVKLHMDSANKAFETGNYEAAGKLSQWAMEKMSHEGVRVVEAPNSLAGMPQVVIGVHLGGSGMQKAEPPTIDVTPIDSPDA